ncbi:hypothetical protein A2715_01195 [Candidatus Woesebacteria bacterium RIFCSPHIGHO2_01_FULL_39_32]|uniref:Uncharacterized protein n=1 Tax=Candidatus Woesebacteria bacterium RIFCSPLOWO2_01_FULL_39_25 TaxID=1802521 RepID=A0A1F8BJH8_9BACT|nr:MAG: hypothetical protein A2124_05245 [Candidatus Woesebacteria bacterium GWB1_37_5]OGM24523.1 MAG: hypothetical protein A2715_01195 [Candidatus Woesebacteria bacterium RIFCSPHIGHO2_01_FULL_39_32]OGM38850.1 MAG: hypothetical protein A3F01_03670 [Candidatus Woesebacteria bacterium RIFCSPHIGHO2_12_FULL_38_11]OGM63829.1 MAG: hypothetical protein A2893_02530 [Candidatus Woesebacteria bacterium RIFCSPLOWO2_01_FULL_39_25]
MIQKTGKQKISIKRISLLLFITLFLFGFILFFQLPWRIGFPKTWAVDCGCLGLKEYFVDDKGINRCSCYGVTTYIWLE